MKRLLVLGLTCGFAVCALQTLLAAPAPTDKEKTKEALAALQEFIGDWKGNGGPDKVKPAANDPIWTENLKWTWRFKGDDVAIAFEVKDGKVFKSGEVRYLLDKKKYQLTAVDKEDKKLAYDGDYNSDKGILTLERTDPDSKETQRIEMNTAAEGIRLIYRVSHKKEGTTIYVKDYLVQATKEGQSLGAKEKKIECVVSGGLGTIPVTFKGETFYVCCSGCKDAFNENPEKFVAEFKAKKKK
jgi:hypothetical protein